MRRPGKASFFGRNIKLKITRFKPKRKEEINILLD
jgi:hypothetical protein